MSRKITAAQKHQLMTKLLATAQGRQRIAANIQEPLRKLRDYSAVGRRAFFIDELPDGTLPVYDMDPDMPAYVVGEEADSIQTVVKSKRLMIPLFELASYPKVPFTQVKERRFDVIRRIKQKSKDELFRKEDRLIFAAMKKAANNNVTNSTVSVSSASFNIGKMADMFARIETHGLRVDKIYMNAINVPVIRKAGRDFVDFETQKELLRTGYIGVLWGASIYLSPEIPTDTIFFVTEPEYFGVIPVRIDLTVIPADDPGNRSFGWSIFENIGIGIHNADLGLQQLVLT
jgi:hypothetical protein